MRVRLSNLTLKVHGSDAQNGMRHDSVEQDSLQIDCSCKIGYSQHFLP